MFQPIVDRLGWRFRLLLKKLTGQLRAVPWRVLLGEVFRFHPKRNLPAPEIHVLEERADGLNHVLVNNEPYFVTPTLNPAVLRSLYSEIFDAGHPNHYEYRQCKIAPGDVVIDGGACEGFFSRFALQRGAAVIIVEPWGLMAKALEMTFEKDIRAGKALVVNALMGDTCEDSWLNVDPNHPTGSSAAATEVGEKVSALTIDKIVEDSGFGRCNYIKMDIEGSEVKALKGAEQTLRKFRPKLVLCAYHNIDDYGQLYSQIQSLNLGYQMVAKGITEPHETVDGIPRPVMLHAWVP